MSPFSKKRRTELEKVFDKDPNPSAFDLKKLARKLGLKYSTVESWFVRHRKTAESGSTILDVIHKQKGKPLKETISSKIMDKTNKRRGRPPTLASNSKMDKAYKRKGGPPKNRLSSKLGILPSKGILSPNMRIVQQIFKQPTIDFYFSKQLQEKLDKIETEENHLRLSALDNYSNSHWQPRVYLRRLNIKCCKDDCEMCHQSANL